MVQDSRGFPLIRALYVTSPDTVTITEEWKNIKAKDLRAYFIILNASVLNIGVGNPKKD